MVLGLGMVLGMVLDLVMTEEALESLKSKAFLICDFVSANM